MGTGGEITVPVPYNHIILCTVYAIAFGFTSYMILKKRDW